MRQPKAERRLNITSLSFIIPEQIIDHLLLIHAMSGCDTTSFLFGVGKLKLYKKEITEKEKDLLDIFYCSNIDKSCIIAAGEKIIMKLHSDSLKCENLNELRAFTFESI